MPLISFAIVQRVFLLVLVVFGLAACGETSDSSSGDSGSNSDYNWPASIVGNRIDFTLTQASGDSVASGLTVSYYYDAGGSVVGRNPESGAEYVPDRYSYSAGGSSARIYLDYGYGYEDYTLYPSSCTTGSYNATSEIYGQASAENSGTYVITGGTDACGDAVGGGSGGSDSGSGSGSSSTAAISVWSSECDEGNIDVYIDSTYRGSLTSCFTSGTPSFGQSGTITVSGLAAGSYSVYGESTTASWGPSSTFLSAGEELLFEFQ